MCEKGQTLRILTAEYGRPFDKPICLDREQYIFEQRVIDHPDSRLKPVCHSTDIYPRLLKCNGEIQCKLNLRLDGNTFGINPVTYDINEFQEPMFVPSRQQGINGYTRVSEELCEEMKTCIYGKFFVHGHTFCDKEPVSSKYHWVRYLCVS